MAIQQRTTSAHESALTDNLNSDLTEAIFDKVAGFLLHCIQIALYFLESL